MLSSPAEIALTSVRLCFYINLPFGLITAIGIVFFFKSPPAPVAPIGWKAKILRFDPLGAVFFIPSVVCLLLALQWGGTTYAWSSGRIIALFVVFGLLLLAFIGDQIYMGENATVPVRIILMARDIPFAMLWGFCIGASFFTFVYYIPIYFQAIQGVDATTSGIHSLPLLLSQVFASIIGGIFATKVGYYLPSIYMSVIFTTTGSGLLTTLTPTTPTHLWIGYQIIFGLGTGFGFQQAIMIAQTVMPKADLAIGSSVMMFCQILGGALFVSVALNTFSNELLKNLMAANIPGLNIEGVLNAGATGFIDAVPKDYLPVALEAYNGAIVKAFRVALIMACITSIGAAGQKLRSIKKSKAPVAGDEAGMSTEGEKAAHEPKEEATTELAEPVKPVDPPIGALKGEEATVAAAAAA